MMVVRAVSARALGLAATFCLAAGALAFSAGHATAAVSCPTVDPTTQMVSPAPSPDVDWAGCDLAGAIMTDANLSGANLSGANLDGTQLGGANLVGVSSGGITGVPASLPANWSLASGYLAGPGAYLANAALGGANLAGADLFFATLSGATLTGADLTSANLANTNLQSANFTGARLGHATLSRTTMYFANFTHADLTDADLSLTRANNATLNSADLTGANLTSSTLSSANFTDANLTGADMTSDALTSTVLTGVNLTNANLTGDSAFDATWANATWLNTTCPNGNNSNSYVDGCFSGLDTTPPVVKVTGVRNGGVYGLGAVPTPGCATTDDGTVVTSATATVTTTGSHGVGRFTVTCAGAVDLAGNKQTAPVVASYTVAYGFGGFSAPAPGSTVAKSARTITARFRFTNSAGQPIATGLARALAVAGKVRITFAGPGTKPVTAVCSWASRQQKFRCTFKIPAHVKTGRRYKYTITAAENLGGGFVTAPKTGKAVNPETVHFR